MEVRPAPRAALPLAVLGAALALGGAAAAALTGSAGGLAVVLMIVGGANLAAGFALGARSVFAFFSSRRGRVGANVAAMTVLAVTLVVVVNVIGQRNYLLRDLTAEHSFSISPRTREILRDLDESGKRVHVTVLRHADPILDRASDLLDAYASASDAIDVERIDLEFEPMRAALFVQGFRDVPPEARDGAIAFECGGNKRLLVANELVDDETVGPDGLPGFRAEEAFTSALLSVTEGRRKTVRFAVGHGEATFDSKSQISVDIWASELRRLNVDVQTLELPTARRVPEGTDLVVIVNPDASVPYESRELRVLDRYIAAGGSLMVMVEPLTPPQIEAGVHHTLARWLERYGARLPEAEIVVDPAGKSAPVAVQFLTAQFGDHPIVRSLAGTMLQFQIARPVEPLFDNPEKFTPTVLVSTSPQGWGETDLSEEHLQRPEFDAKTDRRGPVPLALALESGASGSRIVVVGDSVLGLDLREGIQAFPSRAFISSATNWLLRRAPLVSLPSRPFDVGRTLDLTRAQSGVILWITAIGMPLVVLLGGAFVALRRRR